MKIYFRNNAAKLKRRNITPTCRKCPFWEDIPCPWGTSTIVDCNNKGWWIDGESSNIFKV